MIGGRSEVKMTHGNRRLIGKLINIINFFKEVIMRTPTRFCIVGLIALIVICWGGQSPGVEWQNVVEEMGANGKIDWTKGIIMATGIGAPPERYYGKPQARPMALRAAQLDAYRNLLETVKGVRIDSQTTVENYVAQSDVIRSKVEGIVKGARIIKKEYLSDGTVEVTVAMKLHGNFAHLILPPEIKPEPGIKSFPPETIAPEPKKPTAPTVTPPASPPTVFTGLVVDARGIGVKPAMSPKILDEDGREVYGSAYVSREFAIQQGMTGYAKDLTAAQSNPRVTNNPLTVRGLRSEGPNKANIMIRNDDASKIRSTEKNLSFLKECRVMIVLD